MKKVIYSLLFCSLVSSVSVNAQSIGLGVKLGAIGTKIDGQSLETAYKLSYQGGAFAELSLGKLGVQPELLFSQTSSKVTSGTDPVVNSLLTNVKDKDIRLSYFSIPVLLRYNALPFITLNLGPQYSILLNKNENLLSNGQAAFKSGDFAMVGSVQVHVGNLRAYGRYVLGSTV